MFFHKLSLPQATGWHQKFLRKFHYSDFCVSKLCGFHWSGTLTDHGCIIPRGKNLCNSSEILEKNTKNMQRIYRGLTYLTFWGDWIKSLVTIWRVVCLSRNCQTAFSYCCQKPFHNIFVRTCCKNLILRRHLEHLAELAVLWLPAHMRSCSFRFLVLNYPVLALSGVYAGGGGGGGGGWCTPPPEKKVPLRKVQTPSVLYRVINIF